MVGTGGQRSLPGYGLGYQETVLPLPADRTLGCNTQKRAKKGEVNIIMATFEKNRLIYAEAFN